MGSPDHHRLLIHQPGNGQFTDITHQLRRLLTGVPARDARLDAEQRVSAVFTLVEGGLAGGELGVFCCHCSIP
ncbi:hypothetical protein D3C79_1081650 [compost metagenome]